VPGIEACARVSSGTRLTVETNDALCGYGHKAFFERDRYPQGFIGPKANPATGPIYIEDALPGDALEVEIHDITLTGAGFLNIPNRGEPTANTKNGRDHVIVTALPSGELSVSYNNKIFPAKPMIGVIGTATTGGRQWWGTETGDHGGNMDNNAVAPGAKVYLPVFVEGALLGMGDVHAVMGDGEVFGQGVEISALIDITVAVRKDIKINRPLIVGEHAVSCAASADTMEQASELCTGDMLDVLEHIYALPPLDAALAIAFYGNLRVCQKVNAQKTMRMEMDMDKIELFIDMKKSVFKDKRPF